jgi:serine phosphatase RsbU (regulator of sigma subunit)/anti-sigma regulatory factor (Ser/Thr protein kinase)
MLTHEFSLPSSELERGLPEEILEALNLEFRRLLPPLFAPLDVSLGIGEPGREIWMTRGSGCVCGGVSPEIDCASHPATRHRVQRTLELTSDGRRVAGLRACAPNEALAFAALANAEAIGRGLLTERDNLGLVEELSISWESLAAVYEISSTLQRNHVPRVVLRQILERATQIQPGLRGVLWLIEGEWFEPVAARSGFPPSPVPISQGLLGKLYSNPRLTVINRRGKTEDLVSPSEMVFRSASAIALVPLVSQFRLLGAMAVWFEQSGSRVDSKITRLLETLAAQAVMVLESERMTTEVVESDRLRQEIAIGQTIQQTLLLGSIPDGFDQLQIGILSLPSQTIDGDFHDFISHGPHVLDVVVGDVMGKGIPAALVGAATKGQLLRAAERFRFEPSGVRPFRVDEVINEAHSRVTPQLIALDRFVTLCFGRFHTERRTLEYADCGHTRTVHYRRDEGRCVWLSSDNLPLGVLSEEVYAVKDIPFEPGDWFLFYSDGVTEARNEDGELFGEEPLKEFLIENRSCTAGLFIRRLHQALLAHTRGAGFSDDVTCIAVKVPVGNLAGKIVRNEYVAADLEQLEEVRAFVRAACERIPAAFQREEFVSALELAANELFSNIVIHAVGEGTMSRVELVGRCSENCLTIEMLHEGEPFTPFAVTLPDVVGSDAEGGFGLFIIENSVDEIGYTHEERDHSLLCRIRLTKRFV